ncbi:TldD/PmbA family protein [Ramlibacter monticola]|uniref:TldE/PmbA family protein n=1 Tax=Ramlibacter monticola TaxID=1926872 RepID=A0A937CQS1_9BURK|nr:metallopeptidase TldD-related protein [Ramlibacter monticola]MBL0389926.1 TldE/PmbA family protein [Ramlibacter monticola]
MRAWFEMLAARVCVAGPGLDRVYLYLTAEESDFVRFNHARVRQATHVTQRYGSVSVVAGARRASASRALSGDLEADALALCAERDQLATELALLPDNPYLLLPEDVCSTEREAPGALPSAQEVIEALAREAGGGDCVGFHAAGPVVRAFADSRGQRNWHRADSFQLEWCLCREGDLAVKARYAGTHWDAAAFAARMAAAHARLALLGRPRRTLPPGPYRALFSPVAVADLLQTLAWGGFGERGVRTGVSPLIQLHRGERQFDPRVALAEATAEGLAPAFQDHGFVKPERVRLVQAGRAAATLVSPRTAREYGGTANSGAGESPDALVMAPGTLPAAEALRALGTGVYLSDLHYLNYSDRQSCRVTGMTRFACLWVEDGEPVAPIAVMRFDDSLLRMFGPGLVALTDEAELVPDNATYGGRSLRSVRAPGALVDGFAFTL